MVKFKVEQQIDFAQDLVDQIFIHSDKDVVVFLPGGSVINELTSVFDMLLSKDKSLDFLTITLIDERYSDDPKHPDSNAIQIETATQIDNLVKKGAKWRKILSPGKSLDDTAADFDKYVAGLFKKKGVYTMGVLGVASDSHFAGILPHKEEYYQKLNSGYVTGYDTEEISLIENPHRFRITLNYKGLLKLDQVVLYAVGQKKFKVLKDLVSMSTPTIKEISRQPVFFLHELDRDIEVYTDQQLFT